MNKLFLSLAMFFYISSASAATYELINLGTLRTIPVAEPTDDWSNGLGINDIGEVAGSSNSDTDLAHAFVTGPDDSLIDIHDLLEIGIGASSEPYGINNYGQTTGYISLDGSNASQHAVIMDYGNGNYTDLGTLRNDGSGISRGNAINDSGQVVGFSKTDDSLTASMPFITDATDNSMVDLSQFIDDETIKSGNARGINNQGQAVGYFYHSNYPSSGIFRRAFIGDINGNIIELGTLKKDNTGDSFARGINELGQVAGYASNENGRHAFITQLNGKMIDLSTYLPEGVNSSTATAINDHGHVVGGYSIGSISSSFLFDGNQMIDLCSLVDCAAAGFASLDYTYGINNQGSIVGYGKLISGEERPFVVRKIANDNDPIDLADTLETTYQYYIGEDEFSASNERQLTNLISDVVFLISKGNDSAAIDKLNNLVRKLTRMASKGYVDSDVAQELISAAIEIIDILQA